MWLIEYWIVTKYLDFYHCGRWLHHHNSRGFPRAILLSETVFNSDNFFLHVLKAIASQKTRAFFKALVTKRNRSSYVQVTIYHCEKPISMRCTVTQLVRESVGLDNDYRTFCCSLRDNTHSFVWNGDQQRGDTFISAKKRTFAPKSDSITIFAF